MLSPSLISVHDAIEESGFKEEAIFDLGISSEIIFTVEVPEIGACRVPTLPLSHFKAGADEYEVDRMEAYYSSAHSGKWLVKRDRLRIVEDSWNVYLQGLYEINESSKKANHSNEQGAKTTKTYLPTHATIDEACNWLTEQSGESWTLARLMEYRVRPYFWLDYSPNTHPLIFGGNVEGYLAEIIFNGDIKRLEIDGTDVQVTMTKTYGGTLFKSTPPIRFPLTELRFKRDDVEKTLKKMSHNNTMSTGKPSVNDDLKLIHSSEETNTQAKTTIHQIGTRVSILNAEIAEAKKKAINPNDTHSIWAELRKLAEIKTGALVGYVPEGIQYQGKLYAESGEPDIFSFNALKSRISRQRKHPKNR